MRRLVPVLLAALVAVSGCSTLLESSGSTRRSELTPRIASAFIPLAVSSDLYAIASGKLALQRSTSPTVRAHAEEEVRDHTSISSQTGVAATAAGLGVPSAMMPMHQAMLDALAESPDFDRSYLQQQVSAHQQALALHGRFAASGDVVGLRGVAANAVPVVRRHLEHAQMLSRALRP